MVATLVHSGCPATHSTGTAYHKQLVAGGGLCHRVLRLLRVLLAGDFWTAVLQRRWLQLCAMLSVATQSVRFFSTFFGLNVSALLDTFTFSKN